MVQHIQAKHQAHTRGNLLHQSLYCHEASSVNALFPRLAAYRYVLSCSESACFERSMWMFRFPNWIRHLSASQARGTKHQQNVFRGKTAPLAHSDSTTMQQPISSGHTLLAFHCCLLRHPRIQSCVNITQKSWHERYECCSGVTIIHKWTAQAN